MTERFGTVGLVLMFFVSLSAIGVVGHHVARAVVSNDIARFSDDPAKLATARQAIQTTWAVHDNPIARAVMPVAQVISVEREPGACPRNDGTPEETEDGPMEAADDADDYSATVRLYTFFGIPARKLHFVCGGDVWSPPL